jgi:archaemetzincin
MVRNLALAAIFIVFSTCKNDHRQTPDLPPQEIILQPFFDTDPLVTKKLKEQLAKRLNVNVTVRNSMALPPAAYYSSRKRYIADSLLVFLKDQKDPAYDKILGVTSRDISTRNNSHTNWGIMGLGYCPGEACVISSFRVRKTSRNRTHFEKRMLVLALHELGHTYSLPHCNSDQKCIMKDARGKMNLDNAGNYCTQCQLTLYRQGVLKQE